MTTREDFELFCSRKGWAANYIGDGQFESHSVQFAYEVYQACAAHYEAEQSKDYAEWIDERNALLALIAEKDKALNIALDITSCDYDLANACDKISYALSLTHDSVRLVPIKWEARTSMDGSYFPGAFVPITEDQYNSEEWSGFERRVLYTIVKGEAE